MLTGLYIALQNSAVQSRIIQNIISRLSDQVNTPIHIGGVDLALFNKLVLKDVWMEDQQADTLAYFHRISFHLNQLSLRNKLLNIRMLSFDESKINIAQDSLGVFNFQFLADSLKSDSASARGKWQYFGKRLNFKNLTISYSQAKQPPELWTVDNINMRIVNFDFKPDSLKFRLASLSLSDSKGLYLNDLSADVRFAGSEISFGNLQFQTLNSLVDSAFFAIRQQKMPGTDESVLNLRLDLANSKINFADLAIFVPELKGMDQEIEIAGNISGNLQNLRARNMHIKTGKNTRINCDFDISYFPEIDEPFFFLDLKQSQTDFRDISQIKLPAGSKVRNLKFPDNYYDAGILTYKGNFTGFLSDFVAYGTLNSKMGVIKTDLSFVPDKGDIIRYKGKLETAGFKLAQLYKNETFGELTFSGKVNGTYNKIRKTIDGKFDGAISKWLVNGYTYQNILLDGLISNKKFVGNVKVDDPNLKLEFAGELNLNHKIPAFNFDLKLPEANLVAMNLLTSDSISNLSLEMKANFSGNNLDNLNGSIQVTNGSYSNQNDMLNFKNLVVNTNLDANNSSIIIESDFFDAEIKGNYNFKSLFESFKMVISRYLPALATSKSTETINNQFAFSFNAKELNSLSAVFVPGLTVGTPFQLTGKIDSRAGTIEMTGKIPEVRYKEIAFQNLNINIYPVDNILHSKIRVEQMNATDEVTFHNLALLFETGDNRMVNQITWNNNNKLTYSGTIKSEINFSRTDTCRHPHITIDILPSALVLADSIWEITPARIFIDSTAIYVSNFAIQNRSQQITVNGKVTKLAEDVLSLNFKNINLGYVENYFQKSLGIKGTINGNLGIHDLYNSRVFNSDLTVTGFEFRDQKIGDISMLNKWDQETGMIDAELKIIKNNRNQLFGRGYYNPANQNMMFLLDLDHLSLVLLETLITETFSNIHGDGTGKVEITGTPGKILINGAIMAENAGLSIDFTQVSYQLNDSIRFKDDEIIFNKIEIKDLLNNRGMLNGSIRHSSFQNMNFDLTVTSNKILAINTTLADNGQFYGKALARGTLKVTGIDTDVKLGGTFTTLPETSVVIVLDDSEEVAKYDFVKFLTPEVQTFSTAVTPVVSNLGGVEVDLLVVVTRDAKAQLVYNTQISDQISAQGEGTLRFQMDKAENIYLSGNLNVTQGEYLFTLQNVINKRFIIEPGGSIAWSGSPYNAQLDINAVYKLKVSLYELLVGSIQNVDKSQRIPVECKINLTGDLTSPDINFDILFPNIEDRLKDEMQQYFSTQEDLNKQMLSLLVLGKFYTPEYVRGSYEASSSNLIGSTASDLFSNQLSNWLSQINKDVNIGFNYRPGNQMTNDEIELALSTQIFNDRVTLNGNIGNNANPQSINNSNLVGDFDINVNLSQNGKLQLKAYNRSNNNLIYETSPYTQGIGISYKEEYNTINELWLKFLSIFRKDKTTVPVRQAKIEKNASALN